ncbi:hypothetical protein Aduo_010857 [Ancylostoma duodenale]
MSHPCSNSSLRKTAAFDSRSDIVGPATEEERAIFGEFRPAYLFPSRQEEKRRIASTVERVAAGGEEFVTENEIMENLGSTFDGNTVAPPLRIPKVGRASRRILSAFCARMQSLSVKERAKMEKPYLDSLRLSLQLYREANASSTRNAERLSMSQACSTQRSQISFGGTSSRFSTQSSLLSGTLPAMNSSWSSSLESILSRSAQSSGLGDFPENYMQMGSPPAQQTFPVTPPPSRRSGGRATKATDVRKELDINATVHKPSARKDRNCGSRIKKKNIVNVEECQGVEATHKILSSGIAEKNTNLSRISRKSTEASSVLPKRTPLPFQYEDVARQPSEPTVIVGSPHTSSKSTAGTTNTNESRNTDKETQHRKRKRPPPANNSSCEDSTKRRLRPVLPRVAKK